MATPRPRMHLVDRERRVRRLPFGPLRAPFIVRPAERRRVVDHRRGGGRRLRPPGDGVGLHRQRSAIGAEELVFVERAGGEAGDEKLPDAGAMTQPHRVPAPVPGIEVADYRNAPRVRRPDGKTHTRHAVHHHRMRAEAAREIAVLAFGAVSYTHLTLPTIYSV